MPRPNRPRSIFSEASLATRIAHEREQRGWSPQGLAVRMEKAGCPIQVSAIYKIEKGDPPRRITVAELVGFAQVFGLPVENLLLPAEVAARNELVDLLVAWETSRVEANEAQEVAEAALTSVRDYVDKHPDVEPFLQEALTVWAGEYFDEERTPGAVAYRMWDFTRSEQWAEKLRAELESGD